MARRRHPECREASAARADPAVLSPAPAPPAVHQRAQRHGGVQCARRPSCATPCLPHGHAAPAARPYLAPPGRRLRWARPSPSSRAQSLRRRGLAAAAAARAARLQRWRRRRPRRSSACASRGGGRRPRRQRVAARTHQRRSGAPGGERGGRRPPPRGRPARRAKPEGASAGAASWPGCRPRAPRRRAGRTARDPSAPTAAPRRRRAQLGERPACSLSLNSLILLYRSCMFVRCTLYFVRGGVGRGAVLSLWRRGGVKAMGRERRRTTANARAVHKVRAQCSGARKASPKWRAWGTVCVLERQHAPWPGRSQVHA